MSRVWRPRNSCRQSSASEPLLEHERRAHGGLRPDNGRVHADRERDPSATKRCSQRTAVAYVKLQGGKARTLRDVGRFGPKVAAKRRRTHDLDVPLRGRDVDAARRRMQVAHASERGEENVMVGRIFRDQNNTRDATRGVGMLLKRRIPEILRKVLLADRKASTGRAGISGESQREGDIYRRAIRALALAFELEDFGGGDARRLQGRSVGPGIVGRQQQQRQPVLVAYE